MKLARYISDKGKNHACTVIFITRFNSPGPTRIKSNSRKQVKKDEGEIRTGDQ